MLRKRGRVRPPRRPLEVVLVLVLVAAIVTIPLWLFGGRPGASVTVTQYNAGDTVYLAVGQTLEVDLTPPPPTSFSDGNGAPVFGAISPGDSDDTPIRPLSNSGSPPATALDAEFLAVRPGTATITSQYRYSAGCVGLFVLQFQVVVVGLPTQLPRRSVEGPTDGSGSPSWGC
jgi:hypothetical protein